MSKSNKKTKKPQSPRVQNTVKTASADLSMHSGSEVKEKVDHEILTEIYQNAHVALQSISNLSPEVEDADVKAELLTEYQEYEKVIAEISRYMVEVGAPREDLGAMKKAMMWTSIKMKTLTGADKNKVADMMIKGATMGLNELYALKNAGNLSEKCESLVDKLTAVEDESVKRLRKFL